MLVGCGGTGRPVHVDIDANQPDELQTMRTFAFRQQDRAMVDARLNEYLRMAIDQQLPQPAQPTEGQFADARDDRAMAHRLRMKVAQQLRRQGFSHHPQQPDFLLVIEFLRGPVRATPGGPYAAALGVRAYPVMADDPMGVNAPLWQGAAVTVRPSDDFREIVDQMLAAVMDEFRAGGDTSFAFAIPAEGDVDWPREAMAINEPRSRPAPAPEPRSAPEPEPESEPAPQPAAATVQVEVEPEPAPAPKPVAVPEKQMKRAPKPKPVEPRPAPSGTWNRPYSGRQLKPLIGQ
jgi:hypothetical protein